MIGNFNLDQLMIISRRDENEGILCAITEDTRLEGRLDNAT